MIYTLVKYYPPFWTTEACSHILYHDACYWIFFPSGCHSVEWYTSLIGHTWANESLHGQGETFMGQGNFCSKTRLSGFFFSGLFLFVFCFFGPCLTNNRICCMYCLWQNSLKPWRTELRTNGNTNSQNNWNLIYCQNNI